MIAGETEALLSDHLGDDLYDDFLFGNKEKRKKRRAARRAKRKARRITRKSNPKRIERKEKRRTFFSKLGEAYRGLGGGVAIGGAVDSLLTRPIPMENPQTGEDFGFGLETTPDSGAVQQNKKTDNTPFIIAGVTVLVLLGGVMIYKSNQGKYVPTQKP